MKKDKKLNIAKLNEVVDTSNKILKIVYIVVILLLIALGFYLFEQLHIFSVLGSILSILVPLFIGIFIAWILDPVVTFLQNKKVNRPLGSIFVFFVFLVLVYFMFRILLPILYNQINDFINILPSLLESITGFIDKFFSGSSNSVIDMESIKTNIYDAISTAALNVTTALPSKIISGLTSVVSSVGSFVLGLVIGFYLLIDFKGIKNGLDFIPKRYHESIKKLFINLNSVFRDFVQGTFTIAFIIFIISSILYSIIGVPSPMLFGLISGLTNMIPYIGPWVGGAIVSIVGFTISPMVGFLAIIMAIIVQQLDSVLLQPLIMGKTMKLHPVTIMIGILIFGYFFGVLGMILATPVIGSLKVLLNFLDERYEIRERLNSTEE